MEVFWINFQLPKNVEKWNWTTSQIKGKKNLDMEVKVNDENSRIVNMTESTNIDTIWIDSDDEPIRDWRQDSQSQCLWEQKLIRRFSLQKSRWINQDEDWKSDDEQILYDTAKLRCELLKSIRDAVVANNS